MTGLLDLVGGTPHAAVVADFNGDGAIDLAVTRTGDNDVKVMLGKPGAVFQPGATAPTYPTDPGPTVATAADLDGDGHLDREPSHRFPHPPSPIQSAKSNHQLTSWRASGASNGSRPFLSRPLRSSP